MASEKHSEIARTQEQSASLKRELRLPDLVLLQVLLIVGLPWIGYAAKLGGSHVVLWLAAIALFYFPLAGTVIYLSRRLPLEGGIYQWAKIGLSPFAGFQAAWNYSFFLILMYATSGSAGGQQPLLPAGTRRRLDDQPQAADSGLERWRFFAIVLWVNVRGLHLARWITSTGGALVIALYALIIGLLALRLLRGEPLAQPPVSLAFPGRHPADREPVQQDRLQRAERLRAGGDLRGRVPHAGAQHRALACGSRGPESHCCTSWARAPCWPIRPRTRSI